MKIFFLKRVLTLLVFIVGLSLILYGAKQEKRLNRGYELHAEAEQALRDKDYEKAYDLYLKSSYAFEDPHLKAVALYEAANVGWAFEDDIIDYEKAVSLYKQALRYDPNLYEAAFNLEYLYYIKKNFPEELPRPMPGLQPSRDEESKNGDV